MDPLSFANKQRLKLAGILVVLSLAFFLRVLGFSWGGGYLTHADEQFITEPAYWLSLKEGYDPGNYMRPAHWSIYIHHGIYEVLANARFGKPLNEVYPSQRVWFTYVSRIVSACWGTALVGVVFLIGSEISPLIGVFSILLATFFPSYISHSHFVTPDISLALVSSAGLYFLIRILKSSHIGNWLGLICAIAWCVGEKYPGLLFSIPFGAIALFWGKLPKPLSSWPKFYVAFVLFVLVFGVFFISTPYLVLNIEKVYFALVFESRKEQLGADGLGYWGNFLFYMKNTFTIGGLIFSLLAMVGIFYLATAGKRWGYVLVIPFFFIVVLSKVELHWERWQVPFYILPILLAAVGLQEIKNRLGWSVGILLVSIPLTYWSLHDSILLKEWTCKQTTLKEAERVCNEKGVTKENTLYGSFTLFAPNGRFDFPFEKNWEDETVRKTFSYTMVSSNVYANVFQSLPLSHSLYLTYTRMFRKSPYLKISPEGEYSTENACLIPEWSFFSMSNWWLNHSKNPDKLKVGPEIVVFRNE